MTSKTTSINSTVQNKLNTKDLLGYGDRPGQSLWIINAHSYCTAKVVVSDRRHVQIVLFDIRHVFQRLEQLRLSATRYNEFN